MSFAKLSVSRDLGRRVLLVLTRQKRRKPRRDSGALREMLLHSLEISPQNADSGRFAYPARLQIEQQLEFPLREHVPPYIAANHFLN